MRLLCTQLGVVALAFAGLLQISNRVFGWSSGWLRYIATVTAMENIAQKFELDWAGYVVEKPSIGDGDIKPLFDLAKHFEEEIRRLQSEETDKWVTEFSSSVALLGELIKSQRESSEKSSESARTTFEAQLKGVQTGSVVVSIVHKAEPVEVDIALDKGPSEPYLGSPWVKNNLTPGHHMISIGPHGAKGPQTQQVVVITPGGVAKTEMSLV